MKLSNVLVSAGIVSLLICLIRLFGVFHTMITNDLQWLMFLFVGMLFCMTGLYIEEKGRIAPSDAALRQKAIKTSSCRNGICLISIIIIFLLTKLI